MLNVLRKAYESGKENFITQTVEKTLCALRKEVFFTANTIDWCEDKEGNLYLDFIKYDKKDLKRLPSDKVVESKDINFITGSGKKVWTLDLFMSKVKNKNILLINEGYAGSFVLDDEIENLKKIDGKDAFININDNYNEKAKYVLADCEMLQLINYVNGSKLFSKLDGIELKKIHPLVVLEFKQACKDQIELMEANKNSKEEFEDFKSYFSSSIKDKSNLDEFLCFKYFKRKDTDCSNVNQIFKDYIDGNIAYYNTILETLNSI